MLAFSLPAVVGALSRFEKAFHRDFLYSFRGILLQITFRVLKSMYIFGVLKIIREHFYAFSVSFPYSVSRKAN